MEAGSKRFACKSCGKCCNRSPEVELAEAASLADVFVLRLMFRLYWLPNQLKDSLAFGEQGSNASAVFYGRKRMLNAFSARTWRVKARRDGKPVEYSKYLVVSALALDTSPGVCSALSDTKCGIYDRRPLSCRTVPLHYSRAEAEAEADLDAFVATTGYRCDTGENAPVVLKDGRIVAHELNNARSKAIAASRADRPWAEAISRRLGAGPSSYPGLPTLREIEANAQLGATTASMRVAWQIAADVGLIPSEQCDRLVELQLIAIEQVLQYGGFPLDVRQTLLEMRAEYRHHLHARTPSSDIG